MVEGPSGAVSPSTTLRAVPLPIACGDREDESGGLIVMLTTSSNSL
jgi:hypothetical protein